MVPNVYPSRLVCWGGQPGLLLYTLATLVCLGGQPGSYCIPQPALVHWVFSQVPIVYPNRPWFIGWSAKLLLYTPADPGLLGGQPVVLMYIPTEYVHHYYVYIPIYREIQGCGELNGSIYGKTKKNIYPVFGFSIFFA